MEAVCEMCSRGKAEAFCSQCTDFICSDCMHEIAQGIAVVSRSQTLAGRVWLRETSIAGPARVERGRG